MALNLPLSVRTRKLLGWILAGVAVVAIGIAVFPFVPIITYTLGFRNFENPYASRITGMVRAAHPDDMKPIPQENRLVIPKIGVDAEIVEGENADVALEKGIWHIPGTSSNPEDGNTVLSAHRFRYLPPSNRTFYLLDKLEDGDVVIVYWEGEEYDYTITGKEVVEPTRVDILNRTDTPQLTLFTCAPLFSTDQRLVLYAEPALVPQDEDNG